MSNPKHVITLSETHWRGLAISAICFAFLHILVPLLIFAWLLSASPVLMVESDLNLAPIAAMIAAIAIAIMASLYVLKQTVQSRMSSLVKGARVLVVGVNAAIVFEIAFFCREIILG